MFDLNQHEGTCFISMEFIEGRSLRVWLRENLKSRREVRLETAVGILREMLAGPAEAHAQNVVHRDLKPESVILYEMLLEVPPEGRWELPSEAREDLPSSLDALCRRALNRHPRRRFSSAGEFSRAY